MMRIKITKKNLNIFFDDLRKEDLDELYFTFKKNLRDKFIKICLKTPDTYFLADDYGYPLAIGGIKKKLIDNIKVGQVWFLSSNKFKKNKKAVLKYIKNKIFTFKNECDILFNFIYKSNFGFLKWLYVLDFKTIDINENLKLFYYSKGDVKIDLRYITG